MGGSSDQPEVKETAEQKKMAQIARDKWITYNETFVPHENQWIQDLANQNQEKHYTKAAGIANTSTNSAYGHAMNQLLSQGGNASRVNGAINGLALGQDSARVSNATAMQLGQQSRYLQGLSNINLVGVGKESMALNTMSNAASLSQARAQQEAINEQNKRNNRNGIFGMAIGAGAGFLVGGPAGASMGASAGRGIGGIF